MIKQKRLAINITGFKCILANKVHRYSFCQAKMLSALFLLSSLMVRGQVACGPGAVPLLAAKRVLIVGASITQDGSYVNFMEYYLNRLYPKQRFDIISIGLASETLSGLTEKQHPFARPDLLNRLPQALKLIKPQIVIAVDYGLNDGIYHPQSPERFAAFKSGVHQLITTVTNAGARLVLLTPEPFDSLPVKSKLAVNAPDFAYFAPYAGYDSVMTDYTNWELTLHDLGVLIVDIHTPINRYLEQRRGLNPDFSFGADGIHPDKAGHLLIAQTLLKALGIPLATRSLEEDLEKINADPLFSLIAQQREIRSKGWLDYVGYTRDKSVKSDSIAPAETKVAALQLKIDRLRTPGSAP